MFDAHRDDPEFGYRLLFDEARDAGELMADRTAWTTTSQNRWWSVFGEKRGKNGKKPGPAVHDDLCTVTDVDERTRHAFTAEAPNRLWLTDHGRFTRTHQGNLSGTHFGCSGVSRAI